MSVLLVGSSGSMGKRYQAILKYLKKDFVGVDGMNHPDDIRKKALSSSAIIIATPTDTHCPLIKSLGRPDVPILCEKPITKDLVELRETLDWVENNKINLTMMFQYSLLDDQGRSGPSNYDYFRHGNDGLVWDCLQVIALARSEVELKEVSPIWKCRLNGRALFLSDMDMAYVRAVKNWLEEPGHSLKMLSEIHHKVSEHERTWKLQTLS